MKSVKYAFVALLVASSSCLAQQPTAPQPSRPAAEPPALRPARPARTQEQQAVLDKQNGELAQAAQQVMQLVDGKRAGEVWDGASAVMKRSVTRDEFVTQTTADRDRVGAVAARQAPTITRAQFPAGAQVPQGLYVNVATPTRFKNVPQPVRELVSFRLDEDRVWRVSGYSLR